ncbi:excinuclease ABC subunit UvrC [Desulfallas thermosapovorans]|uniref:UvrABC system protein C n=1 Tax=Desulfallas thermosapovorans DSM 6562 TaxID=1121431 RepID=A0A5S4ZQ86_9FIRM|nr:excinuclease ABC subunit UvrC [Desulfallas thermosapovorans]TYO94842.1 excinuclease ABC subunit C [Desulfallas thermosapovorans DSM 6562]
MKDKLAQLPESPGVYLFRDGGGQIIYVGKAVSLKNRVRSYFTTAAQRQPKVRAMMERARDFEYITTDSEVEALILESNLIKEHRPRYNIFLKDDKSYPYIKVTTSEQFPRVFITRRVVKDGARYFGPYTQVGAVHETLRLLKRIFPLRTCKQKVLAPRSRPCLNQHIKRCLGPCCNLVTPQEYRQVVDGVLQFLEGKQEDLVHSLRRRMEEAASALEFERAAELRDQLQAVEKVMERQKIVAADLNDRDVLAMARGRDEACVMVFFVRGGKLIGREHFMVDGTGDMGRDEVITGFIKQYYLQAEFIPREVLVEDILSGEIEVLEHWLSEKRGGRVYIARPRRGDKKRLVDLAGRNALLVLQEVESGRAARKDELQKALEQLAAALGLKGPPLRMECYDISNIQGAEPVASMVVFEEGKPAPQQYRRFKIKTVTGPDDFASMREVLNRRLARGREERELVNTGQMSGRDAKFHRFPDLLVVDGGKGQLSSAVAAMEEQGCGHIPVCGLAKEEELIFLPGRSEPVRLPGDAPALKMLQRLRDEAHRFAVTYHRNLRGKRNLKSMLEEIEGIGAVRRRELLKAFGSVEKIKAAAVEELAAIPGMNHRAARAVYDFFRE